MIIIAEFIETMIKSETTYPPAVHHADDCDDTRASSHSTTKAAWGYISKADETVTAGESPTSRKLLIIIFIVVPHRRPGRRLLLW
jgi:hypothetical protein